MRSKCSVCGKTFETVQQKRVHEWAKHGIGNPFGAKGKSKSKEKKSGK